MPEQVEFCMGVGSEDILGVLKGFLGSLSEAEFNAFRSELMIRHLAS